MHGSHDGGRNCQAKHPPPHVWSRSRLVGDTADNVEYQCIGNPLGEKADENGFCGRAVAYFADSVYHNTESIATKTATEKPKVGA